MWDKDVQDWERVKLYANIDVVIKGLTSFMPAPFFSFHKQEYGSVLSSINCNKFQFITIVGNKVSFSTLNTLIHYYS